MLYILINYGRETEKERETKLYRWVCVFYLPIIAGNYTRCEGKKYINLKRTLHDIRSKFNSFIFSCIRSHIILVQLQNYIAARVWNIYNIIVSQACTCTFIIHFQLNKLWINIILYLPAVSSLRLFSISHVEILNYDSDRYKPRLFYILLW